jgi:hypothetical protein
MSGDRRLSRRQFLKGPFRAAPDEEAVSARADRAAHAPERFVWRERAWRTPDGGEGWEGGDATRHPDLTDPASSPRELEREEVLERVLAQMNGSSGIEEF